MISTSHILAFALVALGMVMTPGPLWLRVQRWLMAGVLTSLAVKLALDRKPA